MTISSAKESVGRNRGFGRLVQTTGRDGEASRKLGAMLRSGSTPGVAVMQTADLRDGNDLPSRRRLDASGCR